MSSVNQIVKAVGQGFDAERKELNIKGTTAFLLVRNGQTTSFLSLYQLTRSWKNAFNDFRDQMKLQIATLDDSIIDAITRCSDMSIDGHIYSVIDRDKYPPDGDHPFWALFGSKTGETYVPVVPDPEEEEEDPEPIVDPGEEFDLSITVCGVTALVGGYVEMGTHLGKPYFNLDGASGSPWIDEVSGFYWGGSTWSLTLGLSGTQYYSFENVASPLDVTSWEILGGSSPTPTIVGP